MTIQRQRKQLSTRKRASTRRKPRAAPDKTTRLLEWIVELGKQIPPEEQARHPVDGSEQLDHYLYGSPKQ
jgi:hypothetical protein